MATDLTQMPNSFCPITCPFYRPEIKTKEFYSGDELYLVCTTLSCEYEPACKMWQNKEEGADG